MKFIYCLNFDCKTLNNNLLQITSKIYVKIIEKNAEILKNFY
jgi:hypothetical protein